MNENPAYKSGFATLIGRPNVGKSTLMNRLIGQKIAITSNKPQTTRNRIQTVLTLEEGQIVFLDTPGIHKAKNKLGDYMVNVAEHTLNDVDVILWLVEPTNFIGAGERHIIGAPEEDQDSRDSGDQQDGYREKGRDPGVHRYLSQRTGFPGDRSGVRTEGRQHGCADPVYFKISALRPGIL